MTQNGLDNAIRELEREAKSLREAIGVLRGIRPQTVPGGRVKSGTRRLSPAARKRISLAAKKRWAALRAEKKKAS